MTLSALRRTVVARCCALALPVLALSACGGPSREELLAKQLAEAQAEAKRAAEAQKEAEKAAALAKAEANQPIAGFEEGEESEVGELPEIDPGDGDVPEPEPMVIPQVQG